MNRLSRDTNPLAEKFLIGLIRRKSVPQKLSQLQAISSLVIQLSKNALQKTNTTMTKHELNLLFVKLNYGETLFAKLSKHSNKIKNETK